MGTTAASKYAQAQIRKLDIKENQSNKLALEQVEKNTRELIEAFFAWDEAHPVGEQPPINRVTERSPAGLRKYAGEMIRKAARLKLGPKDKAFWPYVNSASQSLASAWWIEWNADAPNREKAILDKARAERERREHEEALKPNAKRISDLQAVIRDAAKGEELLASIFRAVELHGSAQDARKELQKLKDKTENAAVALAK